MITLSTEWTDAPKARAIPGAAYDKTTRGWVLPDPTPRGAAVALRLFPGLAGSNPELVELRDTLGQDVRPFDNATPYNKPVGAPRLRARLEELG